MAIQGQPHPHQVVVEGMGLRRVPAELASGGGPVDSPGLAIAWSGRPKIPQLLQGGQGGVRPIIYRGCTDRRWE